MGVRSNRILKEWGRGCQTKNYRRANGQGYCGGGDCTHEIYAGTLNGAFTSREGDRRLITVSAIECIAVIICESSIRRREPHSVRRSSWARKNTRGEEQGGEEVERYTR